MAQRTGGSAKVEVSAEVSARKISLDDVLVLEVTVTTVVPIRGGSISGGGYDQFEEPEMPHFNVSGTSTSQSTQVTFGSGAAEKVTSHVRKYNLRPKKTGRLKIGPAKVRVGSNTYVSNPITVSVVAGSVPAPTGPGQNVIPPANDTSIFIQVLSDKSSAYVGEQINVSWYAYHETQLVGFAPVRIPTLDDFLVEETYQIGPQTKTDRQIVNGKDYGVTPLYRKAVFPKKHGTLTVAPLEVKLETVRTRYRLRQPAAQRRSAPLTLEIKPLPKKNRPPHFSTGNVGSFALKASVDRNKVKAGEAVVLKIVAEGEGHPADIELRPFDEIEGFKLRKSEPKVEIDSDDVIKGKKVFEYVLIAVKNGKHKIPAVGLPHFNPKKGDYVVAETKPIEITVEGDLKSEDQIGTQPGELNVLKRGIKPIRRDVELRSRMGHRFYSTWLFKILVFFPVALLCGVFLVFYLRAKFEQETDAKRWRRAKWMARKRFRRARNKMQEQDRSGFYGEVSRVLLEILGERLGENVRGLTSDELEALLIDRGFRNDLSKEIIKELQVCDFARFAKSASSSEEMEDTLKRVRRLVGRIQRTKCTKPAPTASNKSEGLKK